MKLFWNHYPDATLLVAEVRLFANSGVDDHGMPTYFAVIDELPRSPQSTPQTTSETVM